MNIQGHIPLPPFCGIVYFFVRQNRLFEFLDIHERIEYSQIADSTNRTLKARIETLKAVVADNEADIQRYKTNELYPAFGLNTMVEILEAKNKTYAELIALGES